MCLYRVRIFLQPSERVTIDDTNAQSGKQEDTLHKGLTKGAVILPSELVT